MIISDRLIDDLGRTVLVRDLRHYSNNTSTLYLRLSVLQGVRLMLETFKLQTVKKVQKLSRDILTYLQTSTLVQQEANLNRNYPVAMDTAAWKYTASVEKTLRDD